MSECKGDASKCACTVLSCSRRGNCCACVNYHRKQGEVPGCLFTVEGEAAHDRSKARFIRDAQR